MDLDGVVAIGNSPGVYIKEARFFDPKAEDELHRKLWLHATAPLLIVIDSTQVRVYSSRPKVTKKNKQTFIETINRTAESLQLYALLDRVQGGEYFETHKKHFYQQHAVDNHFRRQLEATRNFLQTIDQRISPTKIHSLLVNAILLRYLEDRGVLGPNFFARHTSSPASSLYEFLTGNDDLQGAFASIYRALSRAFNIRELLDAHDLITEGPFRTEHFQFAADFLCGHSVGTGQLALGSWSYDLSLLPVELVSAVYQEFLSSEVENAKRSIGLVATPRNLAEVVLDMAFENCKIAEPRILDPACGSGIFLVGCFNRLASSWRSRFPNADPLDKLRALKTLLQNNITGIELQPTACKLAELNLLHALLGHFHNAELDQIINRKPLRRDPRGQTTTTILQGDYLRHHSGQGFDIIVGNPPWSNDPDAFGEEWPKSRPVPARGNLTYGFSWKALDDLAEGGTATLLLDGKAMLSSPPAQDFAASWFKSANVDTIVNFADLRNYLFDKKAGRPAALFRFSHASTDGQDRSRRVRYITPLKNSAGKRGGLLSLAGSRTQFVRYSEILRCADTGDNALFRMWRVRLYGSGRDLSLIERLAGFNNLQQLLLSAPGKSGYHQGFNRHGTSASALKRPLLAQIPFLPTATDKKWRCLIKPSSMLFRTYGEEKHEVTRIQQWPSDVQQLFFGPRVVLHHTPANNPPYIQAAYTETSFSFHKEIHAIYMESASASFLKFLAAALSSRLSLYFMFQSSFSYGMEAIPQLRNVDILNLPLPDFRGQADKARIINNVAELIDDVKSASPSAEIEEAINSYIFDYYDIDDWERDLITDTVSTVVPAALTDKIHIWPEETMKIDARQYLLRLSEVLSDWLHGRNFASRAYVSTTAGTGVIVLRRGEQGVSVQTASRKLEEALTSLRAALSSSQKTNLTQDVMLFDGDSLYLTKTMTRRNWTRSAAMNDADHVISALIKARSH
nr:N-6 DNA methylase [Pseudenhygromyxa sp. WMMC2535]